MKKIYKILTILVLLITFTSCETDSALTNEDLIIGEWQVVNKPYSSIKYNKDNSYDGSNKITGSRWTGTYKVIGHELVENTLNDFGHVYTNHYEIIRLTEMELAIRDISEYSDSNEIYTYIRSN